MAPQPVFFARARQAALHLVTTFRNLLVAIVLIISAHPGSLVAREDEAAAAAEESQVTVRSPDSENG